MPVTTTHPITLEGDHEKRIRKLEATIKRLTSPGQSYVAIFTPNEIDDLDPLDGAIWITDNDTPAINFVINGLYYQILGDPI